MFRVINNDTRTTSSCYLCCELKTNFMHCPGVSVVDFGQVNAGLEEFLKLGSFLKPTKTPAGNYMFKVNNRNTRAKYEICSELTVKTPGVLILNLEHISHLALVFLLLTLSR